MMEEGDSYKFLGIDEGVLFKDKMVFDRISGELKKRWTKIWSSKLSLHNKLKAHRQMATLVLRYWRR